jgi:3',5'-cyclic AMP phosphodiesterase CpdA
VCGARHERVVAQRPHRFPMRGRLPMRIAHFSDLHLDGRVATPPWRFLNKRLTGWVNLRLKRSAVHRPAYVRAIAKEIARIGVDHVIVTGDLTNLALEAEYEVARELIEQDLGLDPENVTIVPGNHDVYTRGAVASGRFAHYLSTWQHSDLPELAADTSCGRFPVVKLRGPVAIVALSTAVARAPFVAAGELGGRQLAALTRILDHPEVARRLVVIATHHPVEHPWPGAKGYLEGLRDAPLLMERLRGVSGGLLLHGHLHRRIQRDLRTEAGTLLQVGATSASLHHTAADRMAGFNLYDLGDTSIERVRAHVYSPETGTFASEAVPKHV